NPSQQQALFLVPTEGSDCQLPRSPLLCLEECKEREATSLIALKGRAGPTCGMLPGQDLERGDGLLFQPWLPAAWGSVLCGLLSWQKWSGFPSPGTPPLPASRAT